MISVVRAGQIAGQTPALETPEDEAIERNEHDLNVVIHQKRPGPAASGLPRAQPSNVALLRRAMSRTPAVSLSGNHSLAGALREGGPCRPLPPSLLLAATAASRG